MAYNRKIRRAQMISPYGVGSIVPFPHDESIIIAGINTWDNDDEKYVIKDERLSARLKVKDFRFPPDYIAGSMNTNSNDIYKNRFVGGYKFPQWFYCRKCHHMKYVELTKDGSVECDHNYSDYVSKNDKKKSIMIPERFIVACPQGHLMNFPVLEYIHEGKGIPQEDFLKHKNIVRSSGNGTSTLAGISYRCLDCGSERTLAGATSKGALSKISFGKKDSFVCPGYSPWLGNVYQECSCSTSDLLVVQRGGSNVWFPETVSSIYIPTLIDSDIDSKYRNLVDTIVAKLGHLQKDNDATDIVLDTFAKANNVNTELLKKYYFEAIEEKATNSNEYLDEDAYRKKEYDILKKSSGNDKSSLYCINKNISEYDSILRRYIKSVSLVYKMTETRAFVGFSRLAPSNKSVDDFKKQISSDDSINWLPAIQTIGEGIFIEFDKDRINEWKQNNTIFERCNAISDNYNRSFFGKNKPTVIINPEYIMIHTFAHLLINELSKKCGYGSSALRERLYVSKSSDIDMCGVLIYTSSGDSEGSLGGLVREGKPGRLEDAIINCINEAEWCSSDPICIESKGQGPDSCNLAACHNCALLPETCCENGNRILDRGLIINVKEEETGFFQSMVDLLLE